MERSGQTLIAGTQGGAPSLAGAGALLAQLRALGPARILALGAVAIAMLGFFAFIALRAVEPPMTLLFGAMDPADSRQVVDRLDSLGVPYRLSPAGDAIMVPADEAPRLRMALAEDGLPTGGTVGNELFDRVSGLTTTDFLADVSLRRAMEGELARTIASLRPVRAARVHLVEPRRPLFRRDGEQASASIVVSLRQGGSLDARQIDGIRHLVAGAVPGLDPAAVSILDDRGNLLARPSDGGSATAGLDGAEAYRIAYEDRLRQKILQLLEPTVGLGRVEVEVAADFDFDELTTTSETYDPASQVARSTQSIEDSTERSDQQPQDAVSVAGNLPAEQAQGGQAGRTDERVNRTEETTNYEISRTVKNQKRVGGQLRRLSIAVQVDGISREAADGEAAFEPRPEAELAQLEALVRSAAGVDDERGDVVRVVSRPFLALPAELVPEEPFLGLAAETWWRAGELALLAVMGLAMLFLGVRPALRRLLPPPPAPVPAAAALPAEAATAAVAAPEAGSLPAAAARPAEPERSSLIAQAAGRDPLSQDVALAVTESPAEAVRVIRGWLHGT